MSLRVYFGKSIWTVAEEDLCNPQACDSAGMAEASTYDDGDLERASVSPAPASTISAAGAGWQGAACYFSFN